MDEPESTVETEPKGSEPESAVVDLAETAVTRAVEAKEVADLSADRAEVDADRAELAVAECASFLARAEAVAVECASLLAAFGSEVTEKEVPGGAAGLAGFLEEAPAEIEEEEPPVEEVRVKTCKACHVETTLLEVGQCPMCGNPFT